MPRNRLDGIKTKRGRVVYDREKHKMTAADLARISGAVPSLRADAKPPGESGFGGAGATREFDSGIVNLLVIAVLQMDINNSFILSDAQIELEKRFSIIIEENSVGSGSGSR